MAYAAATAAAAAAMASFVDAIALGSLQCTVLPSAFGSARRCVEDARFRRFRYVLLLAREALSSAGCAPCGHHTCKNARQVAEAQPGPAAVEVALAGQGSAECTDAASDQADGHNAAGAPAAPPNCRAES